jgi:hypothetical protein
MPPAFREGGAGHARIHCPQTGDRRKTIMEFRLTATECMLMEACDSPFRFEPGEPGTLNDPVHLLHPPPDADHAVAILEGPRQLCEDSLALLGAIGAAQWA